MLQTLYSYTRCMKSSQRLVPYIPQKFYPRYRELQSMAYSLRHSHMRYKTRVMMGETNLVLYKKLSQERSWVPVLTQSQEHSISPTSRKPTPVHNLSHPVTQSQALTDPVQLNLRPHSAYVPKNSQSPL